MLDVFIFYSSLGQGTGFLCHTYKQFISKLYIIYLMQIILNTASCFTKQKAHFFYAREKSSNGNYLILYPSLQRLNYRGG